MVIFRGEFMMHTKRQRTRDKMTALKTPHRQRAVETLHKILLAACLLQNALVHWYVPKKVDMKRVFK